MSVFTQSWLVLPGFAATVSRCHMCGMDASRSQTEFILHWNNGLKEHACSLHCVYLLQKFYSRDRALAKIETRDFSSGSLIDAQRAYYLESDSIIPKGSMAPFLVAFSEKGTADKYSEKYQGGIVTFQQALEISAKFDQTVNLK